MWRWRRLQDSYVEEDRARGVSPQLVAYIDTRANVVRSNLRIWGAVRGRTLHASSMEQLGSKPCRIPCKTVMHEIGKCQTNQLLSVSAFAPETRGCVFEFRRGHQFFQ
jgi:hypothetical protein